MTIMPLLPWMEENELYWRLITRRISKEDFPYLSGERKRPVIPADIKVYDPAESMAMVKSTKFINWFYTI